MDVISNTRLLKGIGRAPYIYHNLSDSQKAELNKCGETILETPLRLNYPILTGVMYQDGVTQKSATMVVKRRAGKSYFYVLQNGLKK